MFTGIVACVEAGATGERAVWLRATGSTAVSQLIDSFVVLYIAFVLGPQQWGYNLFFAVATLNYRVLFVRIITHSFVEKCHYGYDFWFGFFPVFYNF